MSNGYLLRRVRLGLRLSAMVACTPVWWLVLLWQKYAPYKSASRAWLIFDRPIVFFPFDLAEYGAHRGLHLAYDEYVCGPLVGSTEELLETLVNEAWQDNRDWKQRRARLRDRFLPDLSAGNAAACYEVIRRHSDELQSKHHTTVLK